MSGLRFRNVDAAPDDDVRTWPYEALVTAIDRGLVADWQPIFVEIRRSPWGAIASRLSTYASGKVTPSAAMLLRIERLADESLVTSPSRVRHRSPGWNERRPAGDNGRTSMGDRRWGARPADM